MNERLWIKKIEESPRDNFEEFIKYDSTDLSIDTIISVVRAFPELADLLAHSELCDTILPEIIASVPDKTLSALFETRLLKRPSATLIDSVLTRVSTNTPGVVRQAVVWLLDRELSNKQIKSLSAHLDLILDEIESATEPDGFNEALNMIISAHTEQSNITALIGKFKNKYPNKFKYGQEGEGDLLIKEISRSKLINPILAIEALSSDLGIDVQEIVKRINIVANDFSAVYPFFTPDTRELLVKKYIDKSLRISADDRNQILEFLIEQDPEMIRKFAKDLKAVSSEKAINALIQLGGFETELIQMLPVTTKKLQKSTLSLLLEKAYSVALVETAIRLDSERSLGLFQAQEWRIIDKILMDSQVSDDLRDHLLKLASPEVLQSLVSFRGPEVEKIILMSTLVWPTSTLTNSQLSIINALSGDELYSNLINLFLVSVVDGELEVTADDLNKITNDQVYKKLISTVQANRNSPYGIPEYLMDALMQTKREPRLPNIAEIVIEGFYDWTKLTGEEQAQAISFALKTNNENFEISSEMRGGTHIELLGCTVAILEDNELVLNHSIKGLSQSDKDKLKKLLSIIPELPSKTIGDFHLKTNKFIPRDLGISCDDIEIRIDVSQGVTKFLDQFSDDIVIEGVSARLLGGVVYEVRIEQEDLLEILSHAESALEEAIKIHEDLVNLRRNINSIVKVMSDIDSSEDRKFGIELELATSITRAQLARRLGPQVKASNEYSSDLSWPQWTIKYDSSIKKGNIDAEEGSFEAELVSPVLQGSKGIQELRTVLGKLVEVAGKRGVTLEVGEDNGTGLHVHHSIEDVIEKFGEIEEEAEIAKTMSKYLMATQGALYALCAPWRLTDSFSRPIRNIQEISNEGSSRHGFAITSYGTLEFRLKEATFNVDAIIRWVVITQKVTIGLISRLNNELQDSRKKLEEALDSGIDMIISQRLDEAGRDDIISHLAYYQAARNFALAA